jgi:hypothetical protein
MSLAFSSSSEVKNCLMESILSLLTVRLACLWSCVQLACVYVIFGVLIQHYGSRIQHQLYWLVKLFSLVSSIYYSLSDFQSSVPIFANCHNPFVWLLVTAVHVEGGLSNTVWEIHSEGSGCSQSCHVCLAITDIMGYFQSAFVVFLLAMSLMRWFVKYEWLTWAWSRCCHESSE